ncbi:hypothetical protein CsatA_027756 [Cannabis sativa]
MTIDKGWIFLRDRTDPAYWRGILAFSEMAEQHKGSDGKIRCPCVKCVNNKRHTPVDVRGHILRWGFQTSYEQWVFHGEEEVIVADVVVDENDVDEMRDDRENMKYVSTQGTKSLAERRHELEQLQAARDARSQINSESGSSTDHVSIFEEVLGQRRGHVRGIGRRLKGSSSSSRAQSTQSQAPSQDLVNDMSVMFTLFSSQIDPSNMDPAKLAMFNMLKNKYSTPAPQPSQKNMSQGSPTHSQHSAASSDMQKYSTSQPQHQLQPLSQPLPQPSHPPPPYPYMYGPQPSHPPPPYPYMYGPPYTHPYMYGGISQQRPSAFFPGLTDMAGSSQQPSSSQQAQPAYPYQWMMGAPTSQPLQPPHTSQPLQPPQTSQPLQQPQTSQR